MSALFDTLKQQLQLSQIRIGTAVGLSQGRVGEVMRGERGIAGLHVFERIADGLGMPDDARVLLGVTPRKNSRTTTFTRRRLRSRRPGFGFAPADYGR